MEMGQVSGTPLLMQLKKVGNLHLLILVDQFTSLYRGLTLTPGPWYKCVRQLIPEGSTVQACFLFDFLNFSLYTLCVSIVFTFYTVHSGVTCNPKAEWSSLTAPGVYYIQHAMSCSEALSKVNVPWCAQFCFL